MARLLFRLHNVPDDEVDDIRALLDENGIVFYETEAGRWMIGIAAIWIKEDGQYDVARDLIDEYELARYQRIRSTTDDIPWLQGIVNKLWQSPLEFLLALLGVLFVLGISVYPFITF